MTSEQKGVLINRVTPTAASFGVLKENDVLLAFEAEPIGNDGTVRLRRSERVMVSWLVAQKFFGEKAKVRVLREGAEKQIEVESSRIWMNLVF